MEARQVRTYDSLLVFGGAVVHAYEQFGSYQGLWFAKVTWDGVDGWITDYYGSCSGCDTLKSEIELILYHGDRRDESKEDVNAKLHEKLMEIANDYKANILTQEQAEAKAAKDIGWDMEADKMLAFVKENAWRMSDGAKEG